MSSSSSSSASATTRTPPRPSPRPRGKGKGKRQATPFPMPLPYKQPKITATAAAMEAIQLLVLPDFHDDIEQNEERPALIVDKYELSLRCLVKDCGRRADGPYYCPYHNNHCCVPKCKESAMSTNCFWSIPRNKELFYMYRRCSIKDPKNIEYCHCKLVPLCSSHQRHEILSSLQSRELFPRNSNISSAFNKMAIKAAYAIFDVIDGILHDEQF